ncbi:aspartate/glutamate racemase family protein [Pseudomonas aeruginosa]|uniref:aspartate/glutamate racemase family protein n=1 Tax=Pseudomonas aeruginosa TaxID=287 RepID=UPI00068F44AD|nr:amino acid racemase [Pseudomonas aeruginosa]MDV6697235.1 aspartate/glutamate racemase family protein [Pseudomonas aeruginosa]
MIGILGGMGHWATIDLMSKIIKAQAEFVSVEQDSIPLLVHADPTVPDRRAALIDGGSSPLPKLLMGVQNLEKAGAQILGIACHTAHHWYDELCQAVNIPIIHIADAVCTTSSLLGNERKQLAIIATEATLRSGFYQEKLKSIGHTPVVLNSVDYYRLIEPSIAFAKAGQAHRATADMQKVFSILREQGAQRVILACTELPLLVKEIEPSLPCIDPTEILAQKLVDTYTQISAPTSFACAARRG